ncbi:MAG: cobalamin-dependent protein, partial [Candidatus Omnitrophica bacterium]|nr:cobalamin-dependent protein [Candidatus Omnitrophota bacterium]
MLNKKRKVILIRAGDSAGRIPHALLCLAANLDDDVLILDEATPQLIYQHRDEVKNALCAGLSTITGSYVKYSLEVAKTIRQINPQLPLIWGGWHPSLKPQQTLQSKFVDKVVVGQGEEAFRQIVKSIKGKEKTDDVLSCAYRDKSLLPVYNLELLHNIERYIIPYVSERTISLYTSQGCPFGCKFCAVNSLYGNKYSGWPVKDVIELIEKNVKKN